MTRSRGIGGRIDERGSLKMNQHDQELLAKQLWGVSRSPPRDGAIMGFALATVFLIGLAVGGILSAPTSDQLNSQDSNVLIANLRR